MSLVHPVNTSLCLEKLCESNYQKLFHLIPDLPLFKQKATGKNPKQPPLYLKVIERSKHTMTIELSHQFSKNLVEIMEPAVRIRVYFDAKLAEVLKDHKRPPVACIYKDPGQSIEIMDYKWRLNYFLDKWLDHCLLTDYKFSNTACN